MRLPTHQTPGRAAALLALPLLLSSCSLVNGPWQKEPPPPPPPAAPPEAPLAQATHRFVLENDQQDLIGQIVVTKARKEDTLSDIARRFNVGYEELVRANSKVDPWLPGDGREVVVPTRYILPNAPREGVVINVAAMRLFYYPKRKPGEPQVVYTHPIGIGKVGWSTPEGTTKVLRKKKDPTWTPGPGVRAEHKKNGEILPPVVGPGPDNPLGNRAMYLGWSQYLIHGTNKPYGVGLRSSHGCIRLYPEDIEPLFELVAIGEKVTVVNQPFLFGMHEGQLYLQPFDVLEDDKRDFKRRQRALLDKAVPKHVLAQLKAKGQALDYQAITEHAHDPSGIPVALAPGSAALDALVAAAPRVRNAVPSGATWDGVSNNQVDEASFNNMLAEADDDTSTAPKPVAPPRSGN
jgi:L,D-transpeptidase ErfK/SrfK